ncbi:MAG: hypothetical protein WC528_01895 [Patescibacteria group bacterium]
MEGKAAQQDKLSYVLIDPTDKGLIIYGPVARFPGDKICAEIKRRLSEKGFWFDESKTMVFISLTPLSEERLASFIDLRINAREVVISYSYLRQKSAKWVNLNGNHEG